MSALLRLCVFCGSKPGQNPRFAEVARALGAEMARRQIELVYGGGRVGLMGVVADAVLAGGGKVFGVIPEHLVSDELAHRGITELRVVGSMHERKALMAARAQAFVSLPGGFGTLDETFEILTWRQLGLHGKPVVLLNLEGYYDPLLAFIEQAVKEGFIHPEHRALLKTAASLEDLFSALER